MTIERAKQKIFKISGWEEMWVETEGENEKIAACSVTEAALDPGGHLAVYTRYSWLQGGTLR